MKRTRAALLAATGLATSAVLFAGPVGAQEPPALTLTITPTSGPAGTRIIASGTGCVGPDGEPTFTSAVLFKVSTDEPLTGDEDHVNDPGGSWSLDLGLVPEGLDPGTDYAVTGWCTTHSPDPGEENTVGFYDDVAFEVTTAAAPTNPSTPTTPGGGSSATVPAAAPATPVPGDPGYTG